MKENYKMTQMERIEHRKKIEKWAKNRTMYKNYYWVMIG